MSSTFLPQLPLQFRLPAAVRRSLLVAGMLGGEMARAARLPRIDRLRDRRHACSPLLGHAMSLEPLIDEAPHLRGPRRSASCSSTSAGAWTCSWMKRDWTLAATGLAESLLAVRRGVRDAPVRSSFPRCRPASPPRSRWPTSPAVVLLMVQDTRAEGQVTERALNLVALNSLLASIVDHHPARLGAPRGAGGRSTSRCCTRRTSSCGSLALGAAVARVRAPARAHGREDARTCTSRSSPAWWWRAVGLADHCSSSR